MKLLLASATLLAATTSFAAADQAAPAPAAVSFKVTQLDCTAVNSVGYAELKLDETQQVSITVNSSFSTHAAIKEATATTIVLDQTADHRQYRLEFPTALKAGEQKATASLYASYGEKSPFILTSYATCQLNLVEVAP